jgi:hypothetical protein
MIIQQLHDHRVVLVNQVRIIYPPLPPFRITYSSPLVLIRGSIIEMFMHRTMNSTIQCFICLIDSEKSVLVPLSVVQISCSILESQLLLCQNSPALSFALLPLISAVLKLA